MLFDVRERGFRRLVVAVDGRRLAVASHAAARKRQLHDLLFIARATRDHERLGELQRHDPRLDLHAGEATLVLPAPVAQGIERAPPEREVAGSIPAGRTPSHASPAPLAQARLRKRSAFRSLGERAGRVGSRAERYRQVLRGRMRIMPVLSTIDPLSTNAEPAPHPHTPWDAAACSRCRTHAPGSLSSSPTD